MQGVLSCRGEFAAVLANALTDWDDSLVLLSGMVGSRIGWYEMPYIACPANTREYAAHLRPIASEALPGRRLWLTPGLRCEPSPGRHDVMRGEEVQCFGLPEDVLHGTHRLCLPGTHAKWVQLQEGRLVAFRTSMTGELHALLRRHGTLASGMSLDAPMSVDAFDAGFARSRESGGLLHHLFSVRTAGLFGHLDADALPSYLSGLLIGHEVRDHADDETWGEVHVIGSDHLRPYYARALEISGIRAHWHQEGVVAAGLHRIAAYAGLLD